MNYSFINLDLRMYFEIVDNAKITLSGSRMEIVRVIKVENIKMK